MRSRQDIDITYVLVLAVQRDGPVHQVQVEVIRTQLVEGFLQTLFGRSVERAPELGDDEDLGSGHARSLDALSDLVFVTVCPGAVDVSVAGLEGGFDSFRDFTRGGYKDDTSDSEIWYVQ